MAALSSGGRGSIPSRLSCPAVGVVTRPHPVVRVVSRPRTNGRPKVSCNFLHFVTFASFCSKIFSYILLSSRDHEIWCQSSIKFDRLRPFLVIHRVFAVHFPVSRGVRVRSSSIKFDRVRSSSTQFDRLRIQFVLPGEPGDFNSQTLRPFHSLLSTLEELDVGSVGKVPRVHGAEAPGKPLAAAFNSLDGSPPP